MRSIHTCTFSYTYIRIHYLHIVKRKYTYRYICRQGKAIIIILTHKYVYTYIRIHTHTYTYVNICLHNHTYVKIHTHTLTNKRINVHISMQLQCKHNFLNDFLLLFFLYSHHNASTFFT